LTVAHAYRSLGICYGNMGRLSDSVAQLLAALELYEAQHRRDYVASVEHDLATTYLRTGDLARASTHYRRALHRWRETQNSARISETLNGMACALYYQGAYAAARELLEEALLEARQARYARVEAAVLASLGDVARSLGESERALEHYEEALEVAERVAEGPIVIPVLNAIGLVQRSLGQQDRARSYIQQALQLAQESGSAYEMGRGHDALGLLLYADSRLDGAIEHFLEARDYFAQCDAKRELAVVNVHLAQALFEATDSDEEPAEYLRRAVGLADELGYDHFLVQEGRRSPSLYRQAVRRLDNNGRLRRVLEQLGADMPPRKEQAEPEVAALRDEPALRIKAFGQAQVWLHGEQITKKQWDSATTKELFFYLMAHPEGARKDKILEVFWPEATPAKASSAFHSTNYRLRRALNDQTCILYKNGVYMINPELTYWYDVEAFEALMAQAETTESAEERTNIFREAVELYKGDYLDEFYSDWHFFQREELQRAYFDALIHLAAYYREQDRPEEALSLYDVILSADPYQEEIHREIMRTHIERGERAAAVKRYHELRDFLLEDLEIEPMPETTVLYEEILAGE
jgi:DNA-binding SARP family transcriptional activator/Flp pilus assembly protein TadD